MRDRSTNAYLSLIGANFVAKYLGPGTEAKRIKGMVGVYERDGGLFRKGNPNIIVRSKIMAIQSGQIGSASCRARM